MMYTTTIEAIAFTIFFVLALVLLVAFVTIVCHTVPYACELESVKQLIAGIFKIMLIFLVGAIIYFIIAFILEYHARRSGGYVYR